MEILLEGQHYKIISYCLANCYLTEIESQESGDTIARGISDSATQSEWKAVETALRRLSGRRASDFDLMVGGWKSPPSCHCKLVPARRLT